MERAAWPAPRSLALRVVAAAVVVLALAHLAERRAARCLVPLFRAEIGLLADSFVVDDARVAPDGANETVRFRANLARPLAIDGRVAYPFGWNGRPEGGFQVTYTVGGILAYSALMLIAVLAWPAERMRELALRAALALAFAAVLLLTEVPVTVSAELWNGLYDLLGLHRTSGWMIASRFLMGGGGYVIALAMAAAAIVSAQHASLGAHRRAAPHGRSVVPIK